MIILIIAALLAAVVLMIAYILFRMTFYAPKQEYYGDLEPRTPPGKIYEPHRDKMLSWMYEVRTAPHEEFCTVSFDGLKLYAKYYEYSPGAPIELMFHGYRGNAERDLCGGIQRCFSLGHSAFVVDQRAAGKSEGRVITFGINESRDCLSWVDFMLQHFGDDVRIILTGISMGASTVMLAADKPLPKNAVGILADCGYTSAKAIIKKVIRQLKLPADLIYPFVRLGACIFGGFDPDSDAPVNAMKNCSRPIIFFHGEADNFVPCDMSRENFAACTAVKKLVTTPNAGHGLCYLIDEQGYLDALREFEKNWGI